MANSDKDASIAKKKCITPVFRVSYPNVFEPKAFKEGQEAKYMVTMLFDKKKADLKRMRACADAAAAEKWGANPKKWPRDLDMPFRDGDEEKADVDGYKGHIFVSAKSKTKPGLVDKQLQPIISKEEFYGGCYALAEVIAFAYDVGSNKGVAFALLNLQKKGDGPQFSGRKRAEDVFEVIEDSSDDEESYGSETEDEEEGALF